MRSIVVIKTCKQTIFRTIGWGSRYFGEFTRSEEKEMALYRRTSSTGFCTPNARQWQEFERKDLQVDPVGVGEDKARAIPYVSVSTQLHYMMFFEQYSITDPNQLVAYYTWKSKEKRCERMLLYYTRNNFLNNVEKMWSWMWYKIIRERVSGSILFASWWMMHVKRNKEKNVLSQFKYLVHVLRRETN